MKKTAIHRARTRDGLHTFDAATIESTGAFLLSELERLDQTLHQPLVDVSYTRDIDLREDVSIADEYSSFTNSAFAAAGFVGNGKNWVNKNTTAVGRMQSTIEKTIQPLTPWAMELAFSILELESAQRVGRPIDEQMLKDLKLKFEMDIDAMVYCGDKDLNVTGLINNDGVTVSEAAPNGAATPSTRWAEKTHDQILADVNALLVSTWESAGYALAPTSLLIPPTQYGQIATMKVSEAGNISVLEYIATNNVSTAQTGRKLRIDPLKWLNSGNSEIAAFSGLTDDRIIAYTKDSSRVRFPLVPLQKTPMEYRGLFHITTYYARAGVVEFVYENTVGYMQGV